MNPFQTNNNCKMVFSLGGPEGRICESGLDRSGSCNFRSLDIGKAGAEGDNWVTR